MDNNCAHTWTGETVKTENGGFSVSCSKCGLSFYECAKDNKLQYKRSLQYIWIGVFSGIVITPKCIKPSRKEEIKYMGYTYDVGWPKKLNNGRIMHSPGKKKKLTDRSKN